MHLLLYKGGGTNIWIWREFYKQRIECCLIVTQWKVSPCNEVDVELMSMPGVEVEVDDDGSCYVMLPRDFLKMYCRLKVAAASHISNE